MARLTFTWLAIENFKSFLGQHILDLQKMGTGLHFVRGVNEAEPRLGSNGSGKSTVFDALCWCLYGKTPGGLRNPDIKAWGTSKAASVSVEFNIDDTNYTVTRTADPNSLLLDNKGVTNDVVEELLGLNYDVFTNTILLGQGRPLFFDLAPKDKMQLFVDVLQLDRWDERSQAASAEVADLGKQHSALESELGGWELTLAEVEGLLQTAQELSSEWKVTKAKRVKELEARLADYQKELEKLSPKLGESEIAYDSAMTELKSVRQQIAVAVDAAHEAKLAASQAQGVIISFDRRIKELDQERVLVGGADTCPVCGQPIKGTQLDKHKREMTAKRKQLVKEQDAAKKEYLTLDDRYGEAQHKVDVLRRSQTQFEEKANKASAELNWIKPRHAELKAFVIEVEAQLTELEGQSNPHIDQIAELKRKRNSTQTEIAGLREDMEKLARRVERAKVWVKGFKDVRLYLIADVLQELTLTTNATLEEMGLVGWQVEYLLEKETKSGTIQRGLSVLIMSPGTDSAVRWESWSGGEGQRLRLVGALALSEVLLNYAGVETSLEVLDEPTRHLSPEGARDLIEVLAERAVALDQQVLYIDHRVIETVKFASTLTVVKDSEGSRLEWSDGS